MLTSAVPTLNSSNYLVWAPKMTNFLWTSGLNWVLRKTHPEEGEEGSDQSKVGEWDNNNDCALGHILPKMDTHLSQQYQGYSTIKEVWDRLKSQFAKPSITSIYMEFKAMMDTSIPVGNHPAPAFAKMTAHFACLKEFKYELPNSMQVMIALTKLPQYMNVVACLLNFDSDNLSVQSIECMATMAWQQHSSRRKPNEQSANKISTIKRKDADPQFSQQQQQQQQQQPQQQGSSSSTEERSHILVGK
ncbi:hypothetical protein PAXRUDRAFT_154980 [Paxillus rubicundulus Ve08.2h10]|uniref:DUF4219 domain-containing protein n=1 Tax=Paxillus rubicundulus Ve08.2h10 TaxID=930991 RepID=A0A0D0D1G4_9AGAM|nr:hypothetical protein PAXRUDRAFT_154980 [Paxillus rubicundulus Ve08.2h10]